MDKISKIIPKNNKMHQLKESLNQFIDGLFEKRLNLDTSRQKIRC